MSDCPAATAAAMARATASLLDSAGCELDDINAGWCDQWAEMAEVELRRAGIEAEMFATVEDDDVPFHVFLKIGRRYYDSEAPQGVTRLADLPIFKRAAGAGVVRVAIEPW